MKLRNWYDHADDGADNYVLERACKSMEQFLGSFNNRVELFAAARTLEEKGPLVCFGILPAAA